MPNLLSRVRPAGCAPQDGHKALFGFIDLFDNSRKAPGRCKRTLSLGFMWSSSWFFNDVGSEICFKCRLIAELFDTLLDTMQTGFCIHLAG